MTVSKWGTLFFFATLGLTSYGCYLLSPSFGLLVAGGWCAALAWACHEVNRKERIEKDKTDGN